MPHGWNGAYSVGEWRYQCGACGERTTGQFGFWQLSLDNMVRSRVVICSHCGRPTFFEGNTPTYPKPRYGQAVEGIEDVDVARVYSEARLCTSYGAFTSAVMLCRKLLMHVAVSHGAPSGLTFKQYVDYLDKEGHTPPKGKDWVDDIRDKGNEANHEIKLFSEEEAKRTLYFTGLVLQLIYSAPHYLNRQKGKP